MSGRPSGVLERDGWGYGGVMGFGLRITTPIMDFFQQHYQHLFLLGSGTRREGTNRLLTPLTSNQFDGTTSSARFVYFLFLSIYLSSSVAYIHLAKRAMGSA